MPFLERPGFKLHYELVENALPGDVLFLHGNLAANLWWEPARRVWEGRRRPEWRGRMILAEWRGCGASREFEGALDLPTLAEDMNALAAHLGLKSAGLVGHSTGGLIALYAAAQSPAYYERLLLLDSVTPEGVPFGPEALAAFDQMGKDRDFCAAVILGTIHGGSLSETFRQRIVEATFGVNERIWRGVPSMLKAPSPLVKLSDVPQRTLVVHGEEDAVLPVKKAAAMAEALPRGEFIALPGRGHCPNVEDPALFVEVAERFLFP